MMFTAILSAWTFVRNIRPSGWLVILALVVTMASISYCTTKTIRNHLDKREAVKSGNADRELREGIAAHRQANESSIVATEKELNNELATLPDSLPSQRRLARACLELRNDGHLTLPAECGPQAN